MKQYIKPQLDIVTYEMAILTNESPADLDIGFDMGEDE